MTVFSHLTLAKTALLSQITWLSSSVSAITHGSSERSSGSSKRVKPSILQMSAISVRQTMEIYPTNTRSRFIWMMSLKRWLSISTFPFLNNVNNLCFCPTQMKCGRKYSKKDLLNCMAVTWNCHKSIPSLLCKTSLEVTPNLLHSKMAWVISRMTKANSSKTKLSWVYYKISVQKVMWYCFRGEKVQLWAPKTVPRRSKITVIRFWTFIRRAPKDWSWWIVHTC